MRMTGDTSMWSFGRCFASFVLLALAPALGGCNTSAPEAAKVAPAAPEPPAPGVIGSAIGRDLDAADREAAIAAQQEAVSTGQRKSWRGTHGAYGFIEPSAEEGLGGCRDYMHKVYVNGRPQQAKGQACKRPDGSYRVTG
jgi:surface antigen